MHRDYGVLLVDDSPLFVRVATEFINRQTGVTVVGTALTGEIAFQQAHALHPDIIVIDLDMQIFSNPHAIAYLRGKSPWAILIALTMANTFDSLHVSEALSIDLIVCKAGMSSEFPKAIQKSIRMLEDLSIDPDLLTPGEISEISAYHKLAVAHI